MEFILTILDIDLKNKKDIDTVERKIWKVVKSSHVQKLERSILIRTNEIKDIQRAWSILVKYI